DYMKAELVRSNTERMRRIESGEQVVVGVNAFTSSEPSPLMTGVDGGILKVDPASEAEQVERLQAFRAERDNDAVASALAELRRAVADGENVMPASIAAAKAGVTTGEWTQALRDEWGTYRGPTGVSAAAAAPAEHADALQSAREAVARAEQRVGGKVRLLVGKPGLDGHSSGAEQIAVRARDAGFEVIYEGIRLTPGQIVRAAVDEDVHLIGLSILSGSHGELIPEVLEGLAAEDAADIPVVVGGIIPTDDAETLRAAGVAAVYTPKDFEVSRLIAEMAELVKAR
ncbi:MAG: methylmalonyl-CoA mutase family protein, partial [Actinomycetota bacterium]